ncbi:MAG: vitamin K epoxide reductase family protein [Nanoarchaeota archaeon]|nr:vitamin K epoxide reductase family protein [Nanoarchaeota archaeon]
MKKKEVDDTTIEHALHRAVRSRKREVSARHSKADQMVSRIEDANSLVVFLSVLGALISLYMLWLSFRGEGKSFCDDCLLVAHSGYAQVLGLPVALFSLIWYVAIMLTSLSLMSGFSWSWMYRKWKPWHCSVVLVALAAAGSLGSLVFFFVQLFAIKVVCLLCVVSLLVMLSIAAVSYLSYRYCLRCKGGFRPGGKDSDKFCRYC